MPEVKRDIIVICGPTASGKTSLAVRTASQFNLEIISADSRQVYWGMDIGSGKDLDEYIVDGTKIPCHMIDIADPSSTYTLYNFQKDCYDLLRRQASEKKPIIMAGGSGLYIEAVLKKYTLSHVPEDEEFRISMMKRTKQDLSELLKESSPDLFNKTDLTSKKRIVRSLEIHEHSKTAPVKYTSADDINITPRIFCLNPRKEFLHQSIHTRLRQRIEEGMFQEVQNLLSNGVPKERLFRMGMEYKEITLFLTGKKSKQEMLTDLERDIRRMAKSQMTYFRGMERRGLKIEWIKPDDIEKVKECVDKLI